MDCISVTRDCTSRSSGNDKSYYTEELGELGPEGSRKGVYSRQCMMQKEGLEYKGRVFALPLATGEGGWQGAWGSLLSWNSVSWAGFVWQEREGSSCIIAPTAGCDTVSMAPPE